MALHHRTVVFLGHRLCVGPYCDYLDCSPQGLPKARHGSFTGANREVGTRMIDYRHHDDWAGEAMAREITRENARRRRMGESYQNDNEKHKPILRVVKNVQ